MSDKFYITTTLPYLNAKPHIGFALEFIQADVIARYQKLLGKEVFFNTGTDEHGLKIYNKAQEAGMDPQKYTDQLAENYKNLSSILNVSPTNFIRTTDKKHKEAAQEFWKRVDENGYIEKKNQKIKYCVGCELEKTDSELNDGKCDFHPNLEIEEIEEENYFFKFSEFQDRLLKFYEENEEFVLPQSRFNEIKSFVKNGLNDFSISRLKEKMPWGIPIPGDEDHVMYVWFDALVNYISTLGWPEDRSKFKEFWPGIQIAGKDNLRQQSAIWQAMLMAADLPLSKQILIHGFVTSDGKKMSKSLGNVVDPVEVVNEFKGNADPLRYYLLREIPSGEDGDYSAKKLKERYQSDLANGLGNFIQRISVLALNNLDGKIIVKEIDPEIKETIDKSWEGVKSGFESFKLHESLDYIWKIIAKGNQFMNEKKPWETVENDKVQFIQQMESLVSVAFSAGLLAYPFIPATAREILKRLGRDVSLETIKKDNDFIEKLLLNKEFNISVGDPLFPKLD